MFHVLKGLTDRYGTQEMPILKNDKPHIPTVFADLFLIYCCAFLFVVLCNFLVFCILCNSLVFAVWDPNLRIKVKIDFPKHFFKKAPFSRTKIFFLLKCCAFSIDLLVNRKDRYFEKQSSIIYLTIFSLLYSNLGHFPWLKNHICQIIKTKRLVYLRLRLPQSSCYCVQG